MLAIFGPTATGKTSLAIKIAQEYNGEIISADSRQIFKGLDIGSGKISKDLNLKRVKKSKGFWEVDGIKIYGFDLKNPEEKFSVAEFVDFTKKKIEEIEKKNKIAIIAGGTGFYINALIKPINTINVKPNWPLRKKLSKKNSFELFQILSKINNKKAKSLNQSDKNNPRRLIRAIEVSKSNSPNVLPYQPTENVLVIGLTASNKFLFKKADDWLNYRLKNGLIEEVENLLRRNVSKKWLLELGLEYKWISRYLTNELSKTETISNLKSDIHSLIKRQKTFFNKFENINIYDIEKKNQREKLEIQIKIFIQDSA